VPVVQLTLRGTPPSPWRKSSLYSSIVWKSLPTARAIDNVAQKNKPLPPGAGPNKFTLITTKTLLASRKSPSRFRTTSLSTRMRAVTGRPALARPGRRLTRPRHLPATHDPRTQEAPMRGGTTKTVTHSSELRCELWDVMVQAFKKMK
jgi:hypothetical protein